MIPERRRAGEPVLSGAAPATPKRPDDRGGFALALVLVLLFAIGVAGATAYQVVRTEAAMSLTAGQGSQALSAAAAGLERFIAEQRDTLPVERTYTFGRARAVVTPRLIYDGPFPVQRYLLRSEGAYTDARIAGNAARRTVFQVVDHQRSPVEVRGALMSPSDHIDIEYSPTTISGHDIATSGECAEAPAPSIAGVVGANTIHIRDGASVSGSVESISYGSVQAAGDSIGIDWDVVTDASFPVQHVDTWPDFGSIPSDSFPAIRWTGNFDADPSRSGRGLLIINEDLRFHDDFVWDGIILANDMLDTTSNEDFVVRGLVAVGLDEVGEDFDYRGGGEIYYHSCNVLRAGKSLAHLEPVERTWWEGF